MRNTTPKLDEQLIPREVYDDVFKSHGGELPIRGGWGYTRETACVIDREHPAAARFGIFDGNRIQEMIILGRLRLELITSSPPGKAYRGIEYDETARSLQVFDDRVLENIQFNVTAIPESDWEHFHKPSGVPRDIDEPDFSYENLSLELEPFRHAFTTEYWFDISSYHGVVEEQIALEQSSTACDGDTYPDLILRAYQKYPNMFQEIERRDTVFRLTFDDEKLMQCPAWDNTKRTACRKEEAEILVRLLSTELTHSEALEEITCLMEQHYGQRYSLR